jgi:hypothetical protein
VGSNTVSKRRSQAYDHPDKQPPGDIETEHCAAFEILTTTGPTACNIGIDLSLICYLGRGIKKSERYTWLVILTLIRMSKRIMILAT